MLGIFGLFLQAAAGHILYLALHLESGSFPRPLPPDRERAAFADLQKGGAAAAQARDTLIRHNLRLVAQGGGYLRPRQGQALCQLCEQMY